MRHIFFLLLFFVKYFSSSCSLAVEFLQISRVQFERNFKLNKSMLQYKKAVSFSSGLTNSTANNLPITLRKTFTGKTFPAVEA